MRPCHPTRAATVLGVLAVIATAGCRGGSERSGATAAVVIDDFGDSVRVGPASRIVSLNPVVTEFLFATGAASRVVGRTHWDLFPPAAALVPDLGNGIGPNVEAVLGARPDLVILYASASNRRAAAGLRQAGVRTLTVRTDRIADLPRLAALYAAVTGDSGGIAAVDTAMRAVDDVRRLPRPATPPRVFWSLFDGGTLVYTIGRGSYLHELLEVAGAVNVFGELEQSSAQVTIEDVIRRNPDLVIAGPASATRMRASAAWGVVPAMHAGRIVVTDSALVGRPGMRIGEAARHVRQLIAGTR